MSLAATQNPHPNTYYQDSSPGEVECGALWVMQDGAVYVYTVLGWVAVIGGATSPGDGILSPDGHKKFIVNNDGTNSVVDV